MTHPPADLPSAFAARSMARRSGGSMRIVRRSPLRSDSFTPPWCCPGRTAGRKLTTGRPARQATVGRPWRTSSRLTGGLPRADHVRHGPDQADYVPDLRIDVPTPRGQLVMDAGVLEITIADAIRAILGVDRSRQAPTRWPLLSSPRSPTRLEKVARAGDTCGTSNNRPIDLRWIHSPRELERGKDFPEQARARIRERAGIGRVIAADDVKQGLVDADHR